MLFFLIVTFPAVHMSCQAMSPVSHCEGHFLVGQACAALHLASETKMSCSGFTSISYPLFLQSLRFVLPSGSSGPPPLHNAVILSSVTDI